MPEEVVVTEMLPVVFKAAPIVVALLALIWMAPVVEAPPRVPEAVVVAAFVEKISSHKTE